MPSDPRALAAQALQFVRKAPLLHAPVHALARLITRTAWGERFVRGVLNAETLSDAQYRAWSARNDALTEADRTAIAAHVAAMASPPTISVVMPAYATPAPLIRAAIASVKAQLYPHWELCIADDGSPGEALWRVLEDEAARELRLRIVRRPANGHISAATNSALALAQGAFVAFMDHDDLLAEHALYMLAAEIEAHPDSALIFTDEDKIDASGRRSQPYFKTAWNPELMLAVNAVNHLTAARRADVDAVGGLREGFEGAQDHDLLLRLAERVGPAAIRHIPWTLYHWRWSGDQGSFSRDWADRCAEAAQRAVGEHLARTGQGGCVVDIRPGAARWLAVRRAVPTPAPFVSVIVPTRDRADLLARCADGVLSATGYPALELLIVDNGSVEPSTRALFGRLSGDPRVRILADPGPFNYAALMNAAAAEARGEILVLLNNDIEVIHEGWLSALVAQAARPDVGAVGARLAYPDGSVQHAGVVLGVGAERVAGHLYAGADGRHPGGQGHLMLARDVSAVTGACMALRRSVWDEVGGMDAERLAVAFNDIDLCLKLRAAGYRVVWTPLAELVHHELASRGSDMSGPSAARYAAEVAAMRARWGEALDQDPYYGPVFDRMSVTYRPADPPARVKPWARFLS